MRLSVDVLARVCDISPVCAEKGFDAMNVAGLTTIAQAVDLLSRQPSFVEYGNDIMMWFQTLPVLVKKQIQDNVYKLVLEAKWTMEQNSIPESVPMNKFATEKALDAINRELYMMKVFYDYLDQVITNTLQYDEEQSQEDEEQSLYDEEQSLYDEEQSLYDEEQSQEDDGAQSQENLDTELIIREYEQSQEDDDVQIQQTNLIIFD